MRVFCAQWALFGPLEEIAPGSGVITPSLPACARIELAPQIRTLLGDAALYGRLAVPCAEGCGRRRFKQRAPRRSTRLFFHHIILGITGLWIRIRINLCSGSGSRSVKTPTNIEKAAVLRIYDILVWIRIRGSMPHTNGSGTGAGSIPLTNRSGSGSRRPKNMWIRNTKKKRRIFMFWSAGRSL